MTKKEYAELIAHAEDLDKAAVSLREVGKKGRYSRERTHAHGAATSYEIEVVWLRGFLRRNSPTGKESE